MTEILGGLFDVVLEGGDGEPAEPVRVSWDGRDLRAWEAWTGQSWIDQDSAKRILDQVYVAWSAAVRGKAFTGSFDEFNQVCIQVQSVEDSAPKSRSGKGSRKGRGDG